MIRGLGARTSPPVTTGSCAEALKETHKAAAAANVETNFIMIHSFLYLNQLCRAILVADLYEHRSGELSEFIFDTPHFLNLDRRAWS
jgi:hypothetical protein